jgi:S1-C subfamily serine protease
MHTNMTNSTSPQRHLWLLHVMSALGMTFFFLIGCIGMAPTVYASEGPGGNVSDPVVRAVDLAKPAVVRIFTNVDTQLIVHFSSKQSITFPLGGGSYTLTASGTGTFISAHGDILTADHVVNPPHDANFSQFLDEEAAPDIADYINRHTHSNSPATADEVTQELISGQLPSDPRYGKTESQVFLSTDYSGPLSVTSLHKVPGQLQAPIDRIERASGVDEKDVAIVHVNIDDTPSVALGDSSNVQQQDMLTIIGFPGNGDVSERPTDLLTSSINEILVSSLKTTDQGAQVIQVGGNVEDGDSGGPALDSNGNVVGIVSFGLSDPSGTSFLQASNSAMGLVQSLHLDTTPGPLEKAWSQAFNDYAADTPGHWHKAQQELAAIYSQYPLFKAMTPYLQYAQTQAQRERVPRPRSSSQPQGKVISPLAWIMLAAGMVVVIVMALFALALRRRRNKGKRPLRPAIVLPSVFSPQTALDSRDTDEMVAIGPPWVALPARQVPVQSQPSGALAGMPVATARTSGGLLNMNSQDARFYSMWGQSTIPLPTINRVEQ